MVHEATAREKPGLFYGNLCTVSHASWGGPAETLKSLGGDNAEKEYNCEPTLPWAPQGSCKYERWSVAHFGDGFTGENPTRSAVPRPWPYHSRCGPACSISQCPRVEQYWFKKCQNTNSSIHCPSMLTHDGFEV